MKRVKPETKIRNLKKRVKELEQLFTLAGIPLIVIHLPEIALNQQDEKIQDK